MALIITLCESQTMLIPFYNSNCLTSLLESANKLAHGEKYLYSVQNQLG